MDRIRSRARTLIKHNSLAQGRRRISCRIPRMKKLLTGIVAAVLAVPVCSQVQANERALFAIEWQAVELLRDLAADDARPALIEPGQFADLTVRINPVPS